MQLVSAGCRMAETPGSEPQVDPEHRDSVTMLVRTYIVCRGRRQVRAITWMQVHVDAIWMMERAKEFSEQAEMAHDTETVEVTCRGPQHEADTV